MICSQSVTSLEGVTPRVIAVCPRLPPGHSSHLMSMRRFQPAETRSASLSLSDDSLRFGTVSDWPHWQALAGLSWLSFSSSAV